MLNASVWVLIAFCSLIVFLGKPAWHIIKQGLDNYSSKIKADLQEAKRLHKEALALLEDSKRLRAEASHHIKEITSHAQTQAKALRKTAKEDLENYIHLEERLILERLNLIETQALITIENKALEFSFIAARQSIEQTLTKKHQDHLFDEMLEHLQKIEITPLIKQP